MDVHLTDQQKANKFRFVDQVKNFLFLIMISFFLSYSGCRNFGGERFIQLYGFDRINNQTVLDQLVEWKIDNVIVFIATRELLPNGPVADKRYTAKLVDFLAGADSRGTKVFALMLDDPEFSYRSRHSEALDRVRYFLDFCLEYPGPALAGFVVDVEPHILPEWKESDGWDIREEIMQKYVELLAKINIFIKTYADRLPPLKFGAYIDYWYNDEAVKGRLPSGAARNLRRYLDALFVMAYSTKVDLCNQVADEIALADTVPTIHAANFDDYSKSMAAIDKLNNCFQNKKHYLGSNVFDYARLLDKYRNSFWEIVKPGSKKQ